MAKHHEHKGDHKAADQEPRDAPQPEPGRPAASEGNREFVAGPSAAESARLAAVEAELAELKALVRAGVPTALSPADPGQDARSRAEQEALKAEIDKGITRRTQEAADRMFPEGKHRWRCVLADGNRHPELAISAATETDAKARYLHVCGINSTEKQVAVSIDRA